jgi:hypothetical protein
MILPGAGAGSKPQILDLSLLLNDTVFPDIRGGCTDAKMEVGMWKTIMGYAFRTTGSSTLALNTGICQKAYIEPMNLSAEVNNTYKATPSRRKPYKSNSLHERQGGVVLRG